MNVFRRSRSCPCRARAHLRWTRATGTWAASMTPGPGAPPPSTLTHRCHEHHRRRSHQEASAAATPRKPVVVAATTGNPAPAAGGKRQCAAARVQQSRCGRRAPCGCRLAACHRQRRVRGFHDRGRGRRPGRLSRQEDEPRRLGGQRRGQRRGASGHGRRGLRLRDGWMATSRGRARRVPGV